ncbi:dihydroorotate dehydrogenase electron transfer subunit [Candidatus Micrarchaeota archaeon]|nr:dihydroorotate dehydrogenase electron transfer subunit [Candidatus Micrarchaeota archaeon]MBU1681899.1 dihydroorotate dehydrogenase electron transfer subunit [Candidatus Micrarchaeota archaeon]
MNRFELLNPIYTNKVIKVIKENYRVTTVEIDHKLDALPGQFLMVWIPGVGEKPMSIGNNNPLTISVANVGPVSEKIWELKEGEVISYRGPFGNPFSIPKDAKKILCVGGGYGVVPMYFLSKAAKENNIQSTVIIGGRSEKDIVWEKQLFSVCEKVFVTTDDGSKGAKGNVMIELEPIAREYDAIYACGPERMMKAVAELCKKNEVHCQVSAERYMKCGVGVCGSCAIDGKLTCVDGPIFSGAEILKLGEFGKKKREASGRSVDL